MTVGADTVRAEFASIVGESRVVSEASACAAYAVDGRVPRWVVYAPSAEQVAAVLHCAAEHDLAVIPCRNATKLSIGNPPRRYDVALSLKEMTRVWHYEPADLTLSVEPGMKLGDLQPFVGRQNLWLPLDPPGGSRASIGGILAANASGPLRLFYGTPRDMALGLKIATTEGKIIKSGGRVVKNVAGYDLMKLAIGSYGTLGVIVEASLKLFPLPVERATFVLPTGTLGIARELRARIVHSPLQPMRLVLLDAAAAGLVRAGSSPTAPVKEPEVWIEVGGSRRVIERYAREFEELGRAAGATVQRLETESAELGWGRIADFRSWLAESHPNPVILKATLPLASSEEFLSRAQQEAESEKLRLASFCQVGVGIVHLVFLEMPAAPAPVALLSRLRQAAVDLGGALGIERCPPEIKARVDAWGATGDDLEVMRKLKSAWDPKGILAPGRFVGSL